MKNHEKIDWKGLKKAKFIHGMYMPQSHLIVEFDAAVTAPVFGHPGVMEYYETASSTHTLPAIKTPLLVLHALDDPICGMFFQCFVNWKPRLQSLGTRLLRMNIVFLHIHIEEVIWDGSCGEERDGLSPLSQIILR